MNCFRLSIPLLLALSGTHAAHAAVSDAELRAKVQQVVVIYAENRSFDSLYGRFPGAEGLSRVLDAQGRPTAAYAPQRDRDGRLLPTLPQTWGGVTAPGQQPAVTQAQSAGLPNQPFAIEHAFEPQGGPALGRDSVTRDLVHRFFENQMQINGGRNDGFAAWSDAGGLVMGHFDSSDSPLYRLARQYVLADHFFQGAFGGSFLNHQYLVCACAPIYPNADTAPAHPAISALERDAQTGALLPRLQTTATSPASALDGRPQFVAASNLAPADYFGDGLFHAINTMQPPFQPSGNAPAAGAELFYADPAKASTLPAQTLATVGDRLSERGLGWAWYGGGWQAALADGLQPPSQRRRVIYATEGATGVASASALDFQAHHQPFNYYARFDPQTGAAERDEHLKDGAQLLADAAAGRLPAVSFYKPVGLDNQHPGYANLADGDRHIAELVAALQASPQWPQMLIVITYDENGGSWDHLAPPRGDRLGPGTRVPALIVSPHARRGFVDPTPYDTGSIQRLLNRVFDLQPLPGLLARDAALQAQGQPAMGDLTNALAF